MGRHLRFGSRRLRAIRSRLQTEGQERMMADGREEREEEKKRREEEERKNQEDRLDRGRRDDGEPERGGS